MLQGRAKMEGRVKEANQTYVGIDISKDTLDVALNPNPPKDRNGRREDSGRG